MNFPFNALGLSHKFIKENIAPGAFCIDGTAGRGRDTLFLAKAVGETGRVIAFDIQEEAVTSTKELLASENIQNAEVYHCCHSKMASFADEGSVDAIMFNFGWLPGGDHKIFSTTETSIPAIRAALSLLKPGGVMSICLYYGKENGTSERDGILKELKGLNPDHFSVLYTDFINRTGDPPLAVLIEKSL